MPFSDPVADGPGIQKAHEVALKANITLEHLFLAADYIRERSNIAIVGMGYINPILSYGMEKFLLDCKRSGIGGLIIPDLPPEEFERNFKDIYKSAGVSAIFLLSPNSSDERIKYIDSLSDSFIYAVSGLSVTGSIKRDDKNSASRIQYLTRLKNLKLNHPIMVGFGISNREDISELASFGFGAIIGTAFLNILQNHETLKSDIKNFMEQLQ
jgi:tryptophan synthase alpha chain